MKYTPHIIAAVAVAVVATAALATTSNNNITFEIKVNDASIKYIGTEYWFSSSDTIKVTASEPIYWVYYSMDDDGNFEYHAPVGELMSTINIATSTIAEHTIYWSTDRETYNILTTIHIVPPADR